MGRKRCHGEKLMLLIISCTSTKQIWGSLEDNYLQDTKDKEFQLKQQIQSIKMRLKYADEHIKEFEVICDSLSAIHKLLDGDSKVIILIKVLETNTKPWGCYAEQGPYPTFTQFGNALREFDMREGWYWSRNDFSDPENTRFIHMYSGTNVELKALGDDRQNV